jgi:hypothetical protein
MNLFNNKYKFKIVGEEKIICVVNKENVDAHATDVMVIMHIFAKSSSCFVCTFYSTTRNSRAFKANGFVCLINIKVSS